MKRLDNLTDCQLSEDALCVSVGSFSSNILSSVMSGILSGLLDGVFQPDQLFLSPIRATCPTDIRLAVGITYIAP
jgi:hypothetical protein